MGHRPSTRRTVGEMLYDDFEPYQEVDGKLQCVYVNEDASQLTITFEYGTLYFRVDSNDDTLYWRDGSAHKSGIDISQNLPWSKYLGNTLDRSWLTMNKQGHIDGALLSFGGTLPNVALNVAASAIKVSMLGAWQSPTGA